MDTNWRSFGIRDAYNRYNRIGLVFLLFVLYSVGFKLFYPRYQDALGDFFFGTLVTIPVFGAAWLLGLRAGFIAWLVSLPLGAFMFLWCGEPPLYALLNGGGAIGMAMLLIVLIPVGRLHDITHHIQRESQERQKAETALRESQHFVQEVMENIPDIVYVYDMKENRNVYSNAAITSALGYSPDAITRMGTSFTHALIHPDDLTRMIHHKNRLEILGQGNKVNYEYRMKHANGSWRWFYGQEVTFARDPDGSPRQVLGTAYDITEQKMANEKLLGREKQQAVLDKEHELAQLKNHLMTTLSHEFRTPLSIILASGELLDRYFDRLTPTRRAECLMTIKTQIIHLREMLDDIATLVAEGDITPRFNPAPVDLATLFRQMIDEFQASVGAAYTITFTAQGDLNPIQADENLLRPILKNLLSNAIKYSHKDGTVGCTLRRERENVIFQVVDHGIGIPTSEQASIFDTFHRATNAMHIGGLGLGLRIVRDHVKLHRGTIDLQSEEGKGTTVTVCLPVQLSL
jgi:PAS domain S-box-containing protein